MYLFLQGENLRAVLLLIWCLGFVGTVDISIKREIVVEADAEPLQKLREEGPARGFTVYRDEAECTGGG